MIRIHIKATNTSLTPQIEDYIEKKCAALEKLLSKDDTSTLLAVEIGRSTEHHKQGDVFFAEFNLHIAGHDFRARQEASQIQTAVDLVKDELMQALRAHKGKQITLVRRGSLAVKNMLRGLNWRRFRK